MSTVANAARVAACIQDASSLGSEFLIRLFRDPQQVGVDSQRVFQMPVVSTRPVRARWLSKLRSVVSRVTSVLVAIG